MIKRSPILTALAACMLLIVSCKNKNTLGLAIPKDAALVFHIHTSSLASKLSWEEIKNSSWFKEASQKAEDSTAKKLMENPEASGIDLRNDLAFFIQRRGRGGYGFLEGSIKDAAAFEALCKKLSKVDKTEKDGEWNTLTTTNNSLVAWNGSKFAVIGDVPMGSMNPMMAGSGERVSFPTDSLKVFLKEAMATTGSNSLFEDDRFSSLVKEDGDMHVWTNSSALYGDMAGMLSMMKFGNLLSGNYSASTINFEDGKISMKSKGYMGKEMQDLMKGWDSKTVDASVLNRIPSDNIIGVMAANVDPKSLGSFFQTVGFDGFINMMLSKHNLSLNDILTATKGQFVLAFSDLAMQNKPVTMPSTDDTAFHSYSAPKPDFNVLFATSVAQKPSFDKLINTFMAQMPTPPFSYKLNNDWFVAANKPEVVDAFLAGNGSKKDFASKISGHPFGLYIDFQRLLKTNFTPDPAASTMQAESAAMWKDVVATGGEFKNGASTGQLEVNLVDGKTNSLKQLNRYFEKMYEASKKNKMAYDQTTPQADTTAVAPPVESKPH